MNIKPTSERELPILLQRSLYANSFRLVGRPYNEVVWPDVLWRWFSVYSEKYFVRNIFEIHSWSLRVIMPLFDCYFIMEYELYRIRYQTTKISFNF